MSIIDQTTECIDSTDSYTDQTPPPVKVSRNKKAKRILIGAAIFTVLALAGSLSAVFMSESHSATPSASAQGVEGSAASITDPTINFLSDLQGSQYWTQLSADSDTTLEAIGHATITDIQQGADGYSISSDALTASNESGISIDALGFLGHEAVVNFAPQYLPLVQAWANGDDSATIYTLGLG
jgi:hypothetical protein